MEIFVFSHTSVVIQRPAATIWPYLYDRFAWMSTPGTRRVVAGTPGEVGEVAEVVTREGPVEMRRLERILESRPNERFVSSVSVQEPGIDMVAFTHWELCPMEGATRAAMHVAMKGAFDAEILGDRFPKDPQSFYQAGLEAKITAEIANLKAFVEKI